MAAHWRPLCYDLELEQQWFDEVVRQLEEADGPNGQLDEAVTFVFSVLEGKRYFGRIPFTSSLEAVEAYIREAWGGKGWALVPGTEPVLSPDLEPKVANPAIGLTLAMLRTFDWDYWHHAQESEGSPWEERRDLCPEVIRRLEEGLGPDRQLDVDIAFILGDVRERDSPSPCNSDGTSVERFTDNRRRATEMLRHYHAANFEDAPLMAVASSR